MRKKLFARMREEGDVLVVKVEHDERAALLVVRLSGDRPGSSEEVWEPAAERFPEPGGSAPGEQ